LVRYSFFSLKSVWGEAFPPKVAISPIAHPHFFFIAKRLSSSPALMREAFLVMSMAKITNRSRTQIMAEILNLCREPQTKTRVMYKTNLSTMMLKEYLSFLQLSGLLEIHHSRSKYAATEKGLKFLEKWRELAELL
jgi:predicted transcriptional regulator